MFLHLLNGPQKRQTWRNAHFGKKWVIFPISKLQFSEEPTLEAHRKRCHNTFPVERKRTSGLSTILEDLTFPPNRSLIVNSLLRTCPIRTSFFSGSKNPHCGKKVWSEPDSDLAYLGGSKNPHSGKESMDRTRLHLSLFGWIEKSTRWKRSMVRTRLRLSLFGWNEKSTRWKRSMVRTRLRLSLFGWNENSTRWKRSMVRTRLRLSLFWWNEKSTRWKRSMVRTRLRLSLFWWIEKSARWKRSMVRTRLQLSLFWWIEKSTRWKKKVWAEPDFDSAYFGDRKIHTVEKDRRFKEHFGLITKRKFSCLPP